MTKKSSKITNLCMSEIQIHTVHTYIYRSPEAIL